MLITLTRDPFETRPPLTIGVSDDRSEDVIGAMTMEGWHVLSKVYGPPLPVVDSLQVALLEVSTLPASTPIRVAVEIVASAAMLSAPDVAYGLAVRARCP